MDWTWLDEPWRVSRLVGMDLETRRAESLMEKHDHDTEDRSLLYFGEGWHWMKQEMKHAYCIFARERSDRSCVYPSVGWSRWWIVGYHTSWFMVGLILWSEINVNWNYYALSSLSIAAKFDSDFNGGIKWYHCLCLWASDRRERRCVYNINSTLVWIVSTRAF